MAAAKNISANEVRRMVDLGIPISKVAPSNQISHVPTFHGICPRAYRLKTPSPLEQFSVQVTSACHDRSHRQ